jgi:trimethylamine:corrinoid methyltransferase-like protein
MPAEEVTQRLTPVYEILPEADIQKIIDATFQLMREMGVGFDPNPKALDLFADAGCDITSDNAVKFDRGLVEECLVVS